MSPDAPDQPRVPAAIHAEVLGLLPDAVTVLDFDLRVLYLNDLSAAYLRHAEQAAWNAWEEPDAVGTLCCGAAACRSTRCNSSR